MSTIRSMLKDQYAYHTESPAAVFKMFIAAVLIQFAFLSILSITFGVPDVPVLEQSIQSSHLWWGVLGLFGAASIVFEKLLLGDKLCILAGYTSAITSFILLSFDFVCSNPPIHTGGILSVTAGLFLGGILYGRLKHP